MSQNKQQAPNTSLRMLVDTSIIVDVDRDKQNVIELCKQITSTNSAYISTVSISEILTGSYLRKDYKVAVKKAKKILANSTGFL
jgi:uncharacterized protein with PIN domain